MSWDKEVSREYKTGARVLWKLIPLTLLCIVGLTAIAFGLSWLFVPAQVYSPENVRAQWQFAYDYQESLDSTARNYCATQKLVNAETNPDVKVQRQSQLLAIQQNYARVEAEYNGRLRDAFRARLVRPTDVPAIAPTLEETIQKVC